MTSQHLFKTPQNRKWWDAKYNRAKINSLEMGLFRLVLLLVWNASEVVLLVLAQTGSVASHDQKHSAFEARIVGGQEAPVGRYSYTSLVRGSDGSQCGGCLIAPNIVLSAAHCQSSNMLVVLNTHFRRPQQSSSYERFAVVEAIPHPHFDLVSLQNDMMLLKLNGISAVSPIRINQNDGIPVDRSNLTVTGWGRTGENMSELSDVLREANLTSISNRACSRYWGADAIHPSMMCARRGNGFDCQGDSGGPLIVPGSNATDDVLVGLISWGESDCNNERAPGVYARLSDQFWWIQAMVCGLSSSNAPPPAYFDCRTTYSPSPTSGPSFPTALTPVPSIVATPDSLVVTVVIDLDSRPYETGFVLESTTDGTVWLSVPPRTYVQGQTRETQTVSLIPGTYSIVFFDSGGDGMCCDYGVGNYAVFVGEEHPIAVVSGTGEFGALVRHNFTIDGTLPEKSGTEDFAQRGNFPITVRIQPNESPHLLSWSIVRIDLSQRVPYARVPLGTYNNTVIQEGRSAIESTVLLDEHGLYSFVLSGSASSCTSYDINLVGPLHAPLVTGSCNNTLTGTEEHIFVAQRRNTSTIADAQESLLLTLVLDFDEHPYEIGWFIKSSADDVIDEVVDEFVVAFGPRHRYGANRALSRLETPIRLEAIAPGTQRRFLFVVLDSAGDGLCCRYGRGAAALYFGPARNGVELVTTRLQGMERFETSFTLFGPRPVPQQIQPPSSSAEVGFFDRYSASLGLAFAVLGWAVRY